MRPQILLVALLMVVQGVAAAPTLDEEMEWTKTGTGVNGSWMDMTLYQDGLGVAYGNNPLKFGLLGDDGTITEQGTIQSGDTLMGYGVRLSFVIGDTWFATYGTDDGNGGVKASTSVDGGSTWNSGNTIYSVGTSQVRDQNHLILSSSNIQYPTSTPYYESTDTGVTWTSDSCPTSGESVRYRALVASGQTTGFGRSTTYLDYLEFDCVTDTKTKHVRAMTLKNPTVLQWIVDKAWMIEGNPDDGRVVAFVDGEELSASNDYTTLYDARSGDRRFAMQDCHAYSGVMSCVLWDSSDSTIEMIYSTDAGVSWKRSQVATGFSTGDNAQIAYDGSQFYVIARDTSAGEIALFTSSAFAAEEEPNEIPEFQSGFLAFVTGIGFSTTESQMLFAIILIGLALVVGAVMLRIMASGKLKNGLVAGTAILTGVFASILFSIDLWMITLSIVLGVFGVQGFKEGQNTFSAIKARSRDAPAFQDQPAPDPGTEEAPRDDPEAEQAEETPEEPDDPAPDEADEGDDAR